MLNEKELNTEEITEKRKDPTEAELKEYFKRVDENIKNIAIQQQEQRGKENALQFSILQMNHHSGNTHKQQ